MSAYQLTLDLEQMINLKWLARIARNHFADELKAAINLNGAEQTVEQRIEHLAIADSMIALLAAVGPDTTRHERVITGCTGNAAEQRELDALCRGLGAL